MNRQTKRYGLFIYGLVRRDSLGSSMCLALRAVSPCNRRPSAMDGASADIAGAFFGLPFCRTRVFSVTTSLSATNKKTTFRWSFCLWFSEKGFTRHIHAPRPSGGFAVQNGCPAVLSNQSFLRDTLLLRHKQKNHLSVVFSFMAEKEGFEPSVGFHLRLISSQVHSTALPPLHKWLAAG